MKKLLLVFMKGLFAACGGNGSETRTDSTTVIKTDSVTTVTTDSSWVMADSVKSMMDSTRKLADSVRNNRPVA
jgi:ABC-type glycerol-3-phosphate transport system substrate-binding protein